MDKLAEGGAVCSELSFYSAEDVKKFGDLRLKLIAWH